MKCHFVYSIPFTKGMFGCKILSKIRRVLNGKGLLNVLIKTRQPNDEEMDTWPARHPATVAKFLYCALSGKMPTFLYHLSERARCDFSPDDIFIGHPYFPHKTGGYGVTELAAAEGIRPQKFALISPLHCDILIGGDHINKEYLHDIEKLLPITDVLFAIMGEYWWDKWDSSPFAHWKPKMVRLDMAVEVNDFPRIKKRFNKPGHRGFLYIGVNEPRKGTDFLSNLMEQLGDCPKGWIGPGEEIPNVTRIAKDRPLTPEFMATLVDEYDFFISPSRVDPNPTTILQSMAWGFPVVCTPQSGYYETAYRRNIFLDDIQKSAAVLNELQYADESELIKMADKAREVVVSDYNWDKFTTTILEHLKLIPHTN